MSTLPRSIRSRLVTVLSAVLLALAGTVAVNTPAQAAGSLRAAFSLSGNVGTYTVTNAGTATVTGWTITFKVPSGVTVSMGEHGPVSQSGTSVTVTPAYYIDSLAPGRSTYPYSPTVRFSSPVTGLTPNTD